MGMVSEFIYQNTRWFYRSQDKFEGNVELSNNFVRFDTIRIGSRFYFEILMEVVGETVAF